MVETRQERPVSCNLDLGPYKACADPLAYAAPAEIPGAAEGARPQTADGAGALLKKQASAPSAKVSTGLPVGTQAHFLEAAAAAQRLNRPLNALLTVRWTQNCYANPAPTYLRVPPEKRCAYLLKRLRGFLQSRGKTPLVYIWVFEVSADG